MNQSFHIENLLSQFVYSPDYPLLFTSGLFLFFFLIFAAGYSLLYNKLRARIWYVIAFSLFFYYKTSGLYFLLLIALSISDFSLGNLIASSAKRGWRKFFVATSVSINLLMLCYFKYTGLLSESINALLGGDLDFGVIFLPIGISFFTFQSMSYTIDIYRGNIAPLRRWSDYLFFLSFFPQAVAGPIVRAKDFIPQIERNPVSVSREELGRGVFLIAMGLLKKGVISDYISLNFVDRIFDAPLLYTGLENLVGVYGYALQIYCDFSGYSDIAIGIALLLGFHFNDNFRHPYRSATITEFWRRWHISLSSWLKDYLYISLGGNRRGKLRTYINLMITMLLGGLWHGASWSFVAWGAIHGVALSIHKAVMSRWPSFKASGEQMQPWRRIVGRIVTFNIVSLSWIFFRADNFGVAMDLLTQIFHSFNGSILLDFVWGYRLSLSMIAIGYGVHLLSDKWHDRLCTRFIALPYWLYPVTLTAIIWLIMQLRSGEVQPFIYFQF